MTIEEKIKYFLNIDLSERINYLENLKLNKIEYEEIHFYIRKNTVLAVNDFNHSLWHKSFIALAIENGNSILETEISLSYLFFSSDYLGLNFINEYNVIEYTFSDNFKSIVNDFIKKDIKPLNIGLKIKLNPFEILKIDN